MSFDGKNIGKLRKRITIQQPTRVKNTSGGYATTWSTFSTVWANIDPVSSMKRYFSQQLQPTVTHIIVLRYLSGVTSDMRISYSGRIFQIHGVRTPDEVKRWMILDCEEGVGS